LSPGLDCFADSAAVIVHPRISAAVLLCVTTYPEEAVYIFLFLIWLLWVILEASWAGCRYALSHNQEPQVADSDQGTRFLKLNRDLQLSCYPGTDPEEQRPLQPTRRRPRSYGSLISRRSRDEGRRFFTLSNLWRLFGLVLLYFALVWLIEHSRVT